MAMVTYQEVGNEIRAAPAPGLVKIVAIDGPSGAGKSSFARHLDGMRREDAFFARDHTRQRAHLVVDGAPPTPLLPAVEFAGEQNIDHPG